MTPRLAYKSADNTPRFSLAVNKFGPDALDGFRALPRPWQEAVLQACGGAGKESADALALSLSPPPALPGIARIGRAIAARPVDRRRHDKSLSHRAVAILDAAVDAECEHQAERVAWDAAVPLRSTAEAVAHRTANLSLIDATALRLLTASDEDLLAEAERMADAAQAQHESRVKRGLPGLHPRDRDAHAIRRRLRRRTGRAAAWAAGLLRLIGGRPQLGLPAYADDWSLRRWRQVQERGRAYLAEHVAQSEQGDKAPMLEIAASSARGRAAMWYSIILGMRERARRDSRVPVFITASLPSKWHPHPSKGQLQYDPALSPTAAAQELSHRWHWALCMMRERGVRPYGVRTAEPHEDSTPHLHACLWVCPEEVPDVRECLGRHFPAGTPDEAKARKVGTWNKGPALVIKEWETRERSDEGSAADPASYVMHYVLKCLKGTYEANEDAAANEGRDDADRARAWASHVGLRRLALIGLAPGTLGRWRAVYRAMRDADRAGERIACPRTRAIAHAMRRRQWATTLVLLGALVMKPRLAVWRRERVNRWGDTVSETAGYFDPRTGEIIAETRPIRWVIVRADTSKPMKGNTLSIVVSCPRGVASPPPPPHKTAKSIYQIGPP